MTFGSFREALFPTAEAEQSFRKEIDRRAVIGMRAMATIFIGAQLVLNGVEMLVLPSRPPAAMDLVGPALGAAAFAASFWRRIAPSARTLGILLAGTFALIQTVQLNHNAALYLSELQTSPEAQLLATFGILLLGGVAVLPLKPLHAAGLGLYLLSLFAAVGLLRHGFDGFREQSIFLVASVLTMAIGVTLTAILYRIRASEFFAKLRAERSLLELSQAQGSLLVERNAASQGRFAALLSHQLNSPLGSLASAFDTLARLVEDVDLDSRRKRAAEDSIRAGRESFHRINEIAGRMRELANLDRAEERLVDVGVLVAELVEFLRPELENVEVELRLAQVPPVKCRPRQIAAVLASLIRSAASALLGVKGGRIVVVSEAKPGRVIVELEDNGPGITPERLETLFEPQF
ncbi:MAG TPA: HAMP domain-containing sensor histidine kinase, partial [Vicinamibacteria bacterium]|nr:HAMP domain-containing sensor histidine kinase [Vicinamibacteria bacterium]